MSHLLNAADWAAAIAGRIVTAADHDWDVVRRGFNLTADLRPAAIAVPADADDVVALVDRARCSGLRVAVRATGHNAAPLGSLQDTLLIDMRELRDVTIDVDTRRVRAGAGVRWKDLISTLSAEGLAALHGSSPLVGVTGYSLGGGMGWLARKHGLQANSVTAIELVTADAVPIRVDARNDPDLFWALRGGNGNFGVVTAIEFEVYPVRELYAGAMIFPFDKAATVLRTWTKLTDALPDEMMTWTSLIRFPDAPDAPALLRGQPFTVFHGAYLGGDQAGQGLLEPIRALKPLVDSFAMVPPVALANLAIDPTEPLPYVSATALLTDLPETSQRKVLAAVGPGSGSPLALVQIRQLGGALDKHTPGAGARATLSGKYVVYALGVVADEASGHQVRPYLQGLEAALAPHCAGRYPNFVEHRVDASEFFDVPTWQRLRELKTSHDPFEVFQGNHYIPPSFVEHAISGG